MLGICVGRGETKHSKNFKNKIDKMNIDLQIWSQRDLTLLGRILVSKSHGISRIIYSLTMGDAGVKIIEVIQR